MLKADHPPPPPGRPSRQVEFFSGMQRLGFQGPQEVVKELFRKLDGDDGNDTIEYDQFSTWLMRTTSEADFKARAFRSWRVTANDAEGIRVQLSKLMTRDGFSATDLFAAWDRDTDGRMRKHVWLVSMKRLLDDEERWRAYCRDVRRAVGRRRWAESGGRRVASSRTRVVRRK